MIEPIVVVGAGGHAKVVLAIIEAQGFKVKGIFDDNRDLWGSRFQGFEIKGPVEEAEVLGYPAIIAIGSNRKRRELAVRLSLRWATAVHPSAIVHQSVELGPGTAVFAGSIIQPDTILGDHVIVNTASSIDHDCRIGSFAHIAPGASVAGNCAIGEGVLMGIGSSAIPGVSMGEWSVAGAGAAVVSDIAPRATAVGVPARVSQGARA